MADLLGLEQQARGELLGIDDRIGALTQQRNQLLQEAAQDPGMDMGSAIGRLIAASIPALFSGGGRNLGYAGEAGGDALKVGIALDSEDRERRQKLGALRATGLDEQIQALAKQRGDVSSNILKLQSEPLLAEAKAKAEQPGREALQRMRDDAAMDRARMSAGATITAAQISAQKAADREAAKEEKEAKKEAEKAAKETPEAIRRELGLPSTIGVQDGVKPVKQEVLKLKDTLPAAISLKRDMHELRALLDDIGTYEVVERGDLAKAKQIRKRMISKINQIQKFGALSKAELGLVGDQIPQVGDSFFSLESTMKAQLDDAEDDLNTMLGAKVRTAGLTLEGSWATLFDSVGRPKASEAGAAAGGAAGEAASGAAGGASNPLDESLRKKWEAAKNAR